MKRDWTVLRIVAAAAALWLVGAGAALADFSDNFNSGNSQNLYGYNGWTGSNDGGIALRNAGNSVRFSGSANVPAINVYRTFTAVAPGGGSGGYISVRITGGGIATQSAQGTDTCWYMYALDANGAEYGLFYGSGTGVRGRVGGTITGTYSWLSNSSISTPLEMRIEPSSGHTHFYYNGAEMTGSPIAFSTASGGVAQIEWYRTAMASGVGTAWVYFDDLSVTSQAVQAPPGAPTVTSPTNGSTVATFTPTIQWSGDAHDTYEVHVNTTNNPADANGWDSGQVVGSGASCVSGTLSNHTLYYVFARLRNSLGWGNWSAVGYSFTVSLDPPAAPAITAPASGSVSQTRSPTIQWTGDAHDAYEVHVNTTNIPTAVDGWDSGTVSSTASSCTSGILPDNTRYYVFARLHNALGWGNWSAVGYYFDVNTPVRIIPQPQQLTWKSGGFLVNANTKIVMNTSPDTKDTNTANLLRRKVWDMTGQLLTIVPGGSGAPTDNVIAIGDPAKNTAVASIIASWPEASGKTPKTEGYMLGIKDASVVIRGFDQPGTFYGLQTLIQLLEHYGQSRVAGLFGYDYPDRPWRGLYFRVRYKFDVEFTKQVISEIAARYKMNTLVFDISYGTIWNSHPELYVEDPSIASRMSDIAPLPDHCRQYFIEPIPYCSSWVHAWEWPTKGSLNNSLREAPNAPSDDPSGETLCPRNPTAIALVHDLWEEEISIFHPKYLHTGWDEISHLCHSSCPHCAGQNPATSFNTFLWNDYNYLHARGITPLMWADMLIASQNGSIWNTSSVVPTMPKGTIVDDWEYGTITDHPELATFTANGVSSLGAPYGVYNPGISNIYYWGQNVRNYNTLGLVAFNKWRPSGRESTSFTELAMWPYIAAWSWYPGNPNYTPTPFDGTTEVKAQLAPDVPYTFAASLVTGGARLTWTNPPDPELQGTWICYRTDRYPTDPIDGILAGDVFGSPNASMSFTHTAAPLGATIYYAAFSHDSVRHFSPVATAVVNNGTPLALSDLLSIPDGKTVNVEQAEVVGAFRGFFYVENTDRAFGVRVDSDAEVSQGDLAAIVGELGSTGYERKLTGLLVAVTGHVSSPIKPVACIDSSIYGPGLSPAGLLTRIAGDLGNADPGGAYFFLKDGSTAGGVKVLLSDAKSPISVPPGTFFGVTGVASVDFGGGRVLRPRAQADLRAFL